MSAEKEFTYSDVSEHTTKKDLYLVVHDKVYNASSFVDEHPYVLLSFLSYPLEACFPLLHPRTLHIWHPSRFCKFSGYGQCSLSALPFVGISVHLSKARLTDFAREKQRR